MRTTAESIGPHLLRIPDGESGARRRWVGMLREVLEHHRAFEIDPDEPALSRQFPGGRIRRDIARLRYRAGVDPQSIHLETGYAAMAIDSFVIFDCLQRDGVVPKKVKFQIALPSPLAAAYNYLSRGSRDAFLEFFTGHMIGEVRQIAAALPHERIALQWDLLHEVLLYEGCLDERPADCKQQIATLLGQIGEAVPQPIELGYQLMFGGSQLEPLVQPRDASAVVEIMKEVLRQVRRPIDYFAFPVPLDNAAAAFYAPFKAFKAPADTQLYVGLAQLEDDEGNRKRLDVARHHLPVAGIASAWGWGRNHPSQVSALLDSVRRLVA